MKKQNTTDILLTAQENTLSLISHQDDITPHVIVGLSGGPDSVFLLHALAPLHAEKKINLSAAHLNHEWRPTDETHADLEFCTNLAKNLGITLHSAHASAREQNLPAHKKNTGSPEADARHIRHDFFRELTNTHPNSVIALGHHQDDQIETFFIRLLRGASTAGLRGMKTLNKHIIRPLLTLPKDAILEWLDKNNFPYRVDTTNTSDTYLRNRIRNSLIPQLTACDARAKTSITQTMKTLAEEDDFLTGITADVISAITLESGYNRSVFSSLHPALKKRILITLLVKHNAHFTPTAAFLDECIRFLSSPTGGTHTLNTSVALRKKQNTFSFTLTNKHA